MAKKANGYTKIIVVASKKHEAQLTAHGADKVFDYHVADVIEQIKAKYPNIQHLINGASTKDTLNQVYRCAADNEPANVLQLMFYTIENIKKIQKIKC